MITVSFEESPGRVVESPLLKVSIVPIPKQGIGGVQLQFAGAGLVVSSDRSLSIVPLNALKYLSHSE